MSFSKPCRFGANCRFGTKCANEHTEDHKKIFAAKQAEKFKNMRACHNGSRCTKPGCTHGHNEDDIRAANVRLGFIHEIETRVAEFHKIEADLADIDKMIEADLAEEAEEAIQNEFDAFVAENDEHMKRAAQVDEQEQKELIELLTAAFALAPAAAVPQTPKKPSWAAIVKEAPGAPKKPAAEPTTIDRSLFPEIGNWGDE